jgi:hydrogenase 3 maturation protease
MGDWAGPGDSSRTPGPADLFLPYAASGECCIKQAPRRPPEDDIIDRGQGLSLAELLQEPTCLVGVGNPMRRDDGVGPWIVGAIRDAASGTRLLVIDAQDVPENFVHVVARADCRNVVFIDAVAAEGVPGTVVFGPLTEFAEAQSFSTHKLALSFSGRFLEDAGKRVFLLGVVPADLEFGAGLTAEVERAASSLRDLMLDAIKGDPY